MRWYGGERERATGSRQLVYSFYSCDSKSLGTLSLGLSGHQAVDSSDLCVLHLKEMRLNDMWFLFLPPAPSCCKITVAKSKSK